MTPDGPIVLVGLMATGKTTVGRALAERLGREFYDSDAMVEQETGHTVAELWESGGEAAFRPLESEALQKALDAQPPGVVAAAGGVVLSAANRQLLGKAALVVWLRADPVLLATRVAPGDHRPLLASDPRATLAQMQRDRAALYAEVADVAIDVDGRSVDDVVNQIADAVLAAR